MPSYTPYTLDLSNEFKGRSAIITGGSRGMGAAIAQRFLDAGAEVVVTARSRHDETPAEAKFIAADLRTDQAAKAFATEALEALGGGVDILINNAGAARVHLGGSHTIPDDEWTDSLDINFLSAVRVTNALLEPLKASENAVILNVASGGITPLPGPLAHYGAAKAALKVYTLSLAADLAPEQVRVNILTPGPVITPGGDDIRQVFMDAMGIPAEAFAQQVPLGRFGETWEVAEMAALLASDRGGWITAHEYYVDGGQGSK